MKVAYMQQGKATMCQTWDEQLQANVYRQAQGAGDKLDERVRQYAEKHGTSYCQALTAVVECAPELAREYAGRATQEPESPAGNVEDIRTRAGNELDRLTREYMREHGTQGFADAFGEVCRVNPHLQKQYLYGTE